MPLSPIRQQRQARLDPVHRWPGCAMSAGATLGLAAKSKSCAAACRAGNPAADRGQPGRAPGRGRRTRPTAARPGSPGRCICSRAAACGEVGGRSRMVGSRSIRQAWSTAASAACRSARRGCARCSSRDGSFPAVPEAPAAGRRRPPTAQDGRVRRQPGSPPLGREVTAAAATCGRAGPAPGRLPGSVGHGRGMLAGLDRDRVGGHAPAVSAAASPAIDLLPAACAGAAAAPRSAPGSRPRRRAGPRAAAQHASWTRGEHARGAGLCQRASTRAARRACGPGSPGSGPGPGARRRTCRSAAGGPRPACAAVEDAQLVRGQHRPHPGVDQPGGHRIAVLADADPGIPVHSRPLHCGAVSNGSDGSGRSSRCSAEKSCPTVAAR